MLIAAEKVPTTKKLATQIQAAQTMRWLHAEEPKTPAQVFKLLKLDKEGLVLFQNPLFGAWMQYTDDFRRIHFGNKLTTISTLRRYYRDDVLAKMILAASKSQGTANIGARLYAELLRTWFINKFSPENVFKLLKLDRAGDTFFENPLFTVWLKYVKYVNDADPKQKINLLTTLTTVIRERDLAKAFIVGKNVPELKNIASKLQTAQLRSWLSAKKDPVEVFYLLRAIEGGEGAALYTTYISAFKAASSKRKTTNTKT
ncbi:unnamed protein product [Phytophthora lilii]|uniref:Unnamed protein product n=1 Tax=Phytophthora lilii TaxID=2077276 RepID=A0A9W6U8Q2_9STRA|nr:unnamed protein product [Phytophthora lilii]